MRKVKGDTAPSRTPDGALAGPLCGYGVLFVQRLAAIRAAQVSGEAKRGARDYFEPGTAARSRIPIELDRLLGRLGLELVEIGEALSQVVRRHPL